MGSVDVVVILVTEVVVRGVIIMSLIIWVVVGVMFGLSP